MVMIGISISQGVFIRIISYISVVTLLLYNAPTHLDDWARHVVARDCYPLDKGLLKMRKST